MIDDVDRPASTPDGAANRACSLGDTPSDESIVPRIGTNDFEAPHNITAGTRHEDVVKAFIA